MEIINLDMVPGKKSPVCHASQYDDGRVIRFNLYDSGLPYTLDGTETITFKVRKPDGNIVTSTLTNTSDSYVDVVTTEQMTAVKGANLCEVRVEKGATNIGSLNVIMAVEMDPTDGGIASASEIDNLRSQISGMVAEEVADQYDSANVIFDSAPTPGHGNGYAVTSEGVNNALAPKADRSELPDMTNYYDKTETDDLLDQKADTSDLPDMSNYYTKSETDTALDDKVNTSDFNATNLPISDSDPTDTKSYIDSLAISDLSNDLEIGKLIKGTESGSVNVASASGTEVGSITLNKGKYVILGGIDWATNSTGFRQVAFAANRDPSRDAGVCQPACASPKETYQQIVSFRDIQTDNTEIKLYGWQDSGSTLGAYAFIYAIKIY